MTLVLQRSEIEQLIDIRSALDLLREGFAQDDQVVIPGQRVRTELPGPGTATVLVPGLLPGIPAYTVKVNAKFPEARPALRGVICLHDLGTGELLALLDSSSITAWRTGLAAALATDLLAGGGAGADGSTVGIIGCGAQAAMTVRGLSQLRRVDRLVVHDVDPSAAAAFAARHDGRIGQATVVDGPAAVAAVADIVVLATWSREPLLRLHECRAGQHLTSLGADEPGKSELDRDVLEAATLVVDDRELVQRVGAVATAGLDGSAIAASLGEIVRGRHPGRTSSGAITVYAPVGLPWQDLALAWVVLRRASEQGVGTQLDLLSQMDGRGSS